MEAACSSEMLECTFTTQCITLHSDNHVATFPCNAMRMMWQRYANNLQDGSGDSSNPSWTEAIMISTLVYIKAFVTQNNNLQILT